jgi:NTP pyrophosphatase (non-canonical NTP hydrolase)
MTLKQAQEQVDVWVKTIGVRYFSELTNTAILMEEVGEVARIKVLKKPISPRIWATRWRMCFLS